MLKSISVLLLVFLSTYVIKKLWVSNPAELIKDLFNEGVGYIGDVNYSVHRRNIQRGAVSKKKTFTSSQYYKLCSEILSDLEMGDVTVEAFTLTLIFLDLVINIGIYTLTGALFLYFTGLIVVYVAMLAMLYMLASIGHFDKLFAVMDAEDLIISTIDRGVTMSIRLNLDSFSPIVQGHFKEFLKDMDEYKVSFVDAIEKLNRNLGDKFTDFTKKAIQLENNQRAGSMEVFNDTIMINSDLRIDTMEIMQVLQEANAEFAMGVMVLMAFTMLFFGAAPGLLNLLFTTKTGQLLLSANVGVVIFGFAFLQSLRKDINVRGDI